MMRRALIKVPSTFAHNAVKDLSMRSPQYSPCPFSPSEGEKVADRPDEGVVAIDALQSLS